MLGSWRCRGQITASRRNREEQEAFLSGGNGIRNGMQPSAISNILGELIIACM